MTELTMHRTRISGQEWSGFKPGPAPTVSAPIEVEETTFVPVGEVERLREAAMILLGYAQIGQSPPQVFVDAVAVLRVYNAARSALSSEGM